MPPSPEFTSVLTARLDAISSLRPHEADHVSKVATRPRERFEAQATLPDPVSRRIPYMIASGWVGLVHLRKNGARQIVQIILPGDIIGLAPQPMPGLFPIALTNVATLPLPEMQSIGGDDRTGLVGRREALLAEQCFLQVNHIIRLGRASAYCRFANLLAELYWRLRQRGLASASSYVLPITQEHIGDTLGLSYVHVNRTLQQLRREKLIRHEPGRIVYIDPAGMAAAGEFTPPQIAR